MTHGISSELREKWYGALVAIPNQTFLSQITALLGKIKTPYNKQHLLERLESHLSRSEVQNSIVSGLTDMDKAILSVVVLSREPSTALITRLVEPVFMRANVHSHIEQLLGSFVLYASAIDDDYIYSVAPPLLDVIHPFIGYSTFLPLDASTSMSGSSSAAAVTTVGAVYRDVPPVTDMEIAALISFVMMHKKVRKVSGEFTAAAARDAVSTFQSKAPRQEKLLNAMINLSLFTEGNTLQVNWPLMEKFASLNAHHREALLCAAYVVDSKTTKLIQRLAQTLLDCQATAGDRGISKQLLNNMAVVLFESDPLLVTSRYDSFLSRNSKPRGVEGGTPYFDMAELFYDVVDAACDFGYIQDEAGNCRFRFTGLDTPQQREGGYSTTLTSGTQPPACGGFDASTPLVTIDASFTVTVMPGLELLRMLRIVPFLSLVSSQTASVFSVTRESAIHAFDMGLSVGDITKTLEEYTAQKSPDSLVVSLESWYEAYTSVHLYRGYVVQLTESAARRFECSTDYGKVVHQKIADGVYLLEIPVMSLHDSDNDAVKVLARFGFKYIDKVEGILTEAEKHYMKRRGILPTLCDGRSIFDRPTMGCFGLKASQ